jgi:hypothetical protein
MRSHYFLIEHPTRGVYYSTEYEFHPRGSVPKHHFSWSKPRTDPGMKRFYNLEEAKRVCSLMMIRGCYVLELFRERGKHPVRHVPTKDGWVERSD